MWKKSLSGLTGSFLKNLYESDKLNMQGLELDSDGPIGGKNFETHDLVIVAEQNHESAKQKYSERENKNWGLSFSSIDISLCFGIYVLSAAILILVN